MSLSDQTKAWLRAHCGVSLAGKTVLITGANSGIGFKTAEIAVHLGARVLLACRNAARAAAARDALLRDYLGASADVMQLDLADFSSIDTFVAEIRSRALDLDVFVNNAGAFRKPGQTTKQGFDLVFGTNYVGVYALTEKLLPYLSSLPHRVVYVNTISLVHQFVKRVGRADFYSTQPPRSVAVYARSKLALAKYSYALAQRCAGGNVRVVMSHPGIAVTPLGLDAFGPWARRLAGVGGRLFNSPEKSALTLAFLLSREAPNGALFGPGKGLGGWGYPTQNRVLRRVKEGGDDLIRMTDEEIRRQTGGRPSAEAQ